MAVYEIFNEADAFNVNQAEPDNRDFKILAAGFERTGVLSGCAVTAGAGMTCAVAAGTITYTDDTTAVTVGGGSVTIEAAHGTLPRFDFVMVDDAGNLVNPVAGNGKGTAAAEPVFPTIPANRVVLAAVYIPAAVVSILSTYLIDKRVMLTPIVTRHVIAGTLAARPAPMMDERIYHATNTDQVFVDDTTQWRHIGGRGLFDDWCPPRAVGDLSAAATLRSGHTWTEDFGDVDIVDVVGANQNALQATTTSIIVAETGAPLEVAHFGMEFQAPSASVANMHLSLILRYVSVTTYLYVALRATAIEFRKNVSSVDTLIKSIAVNSPVANQALLFQAWIRGATIIVRTSGLDAQVDGGYIFHHSDADNTLVPGGGSGFAGATKVGIRFGNSGSTSEKVFDYFCTPGA
jgi:hypothetical protein